ncbi:MAG: hypothetical protein CDV28_10256 [Candidatus Electronema aureum]|uniref:Uncharacterized protein n=1 Tax=Candidatus Electronema aureum TaxID=2005002 RepID=A0A521G4I1_9BACT|nr:MAG: hypothetical protein CDV28_10256 [Candidatus Electronema aureum]
MEIQGFSVLLIMGNMLIDSFMTDLKIFGCGELAADLFRTPILAEKIIDNMPYFFGKSRFGLFLAALTRQLLCLLGPIAAFTAITLQFSIDS